MRRESNTYFIKGGILKQPLKEKEKRGFNGGGGIEVGNDGDWGGVERGWGRRV